MEKLCHINNHTTGRGKWLKHSAANQNLQVQIPPVIAIGEISFSPGVDSAPPLKMSIGVFLKALSPDRVHSSHHNPSYGCKVVGPGVLVSISILFCVNNYTTSRG